MRFSQSLLYYTLSFTSEASVSGGPELVFILNLSAFLALYG